MADRVTVAETGQQWCRLGAVLSRVVGRSLLCAAVASSLAITAAASSTRSSGRPPSAPQAAAGMWAPTAAPAANGPTAIGGPPTASPGGAAGTAANGPAGGPSSGPSPPVGMFEDLQYLTGAALSSRLDQYVQAGVKLARFQLIWSSVQPTSPSTYDWTAIDAVVSGLNARGIGALPVIDTTPQWARLSKCKHMEVCAPADPNKYAAFAGAAAARYASQGVHSWEIWNEPNNPIFWQPKPNVSAYTALLKAAYTAIHQVDPTATVVSGGPAPAATHGGWVSPLDFVKGIYANGGQSFFDALGWHPYDYPAPPSSTSNNAWYQMFGTTPSARSLMAAHGDSAKQIWATEFGAPTCTRDPTCVSEATQAQIISQGYSMWASYSWAGPFVVYSYADLGTNQKNREDFFGLVRFDGTAKPSYAAYLNIAGK
jgi:hypothetical protein